MNLKNDNRHDQMMPILGCLKWEFAKIDYIEDLTIEDEIKEGRLKVAEKNNLNIKNNNVDENYKYEWYLEYKNKKFYKVTVKIKNNSIIQENIKEYK